jgi:two-component system cell cycle response regulator
LTGLNNRRAYDSDLFREAERAIRSKYPLALARLDLDNFKIVNDTYGHGAGDEVLKQYARIFRDVVRGTDGTYRAGGEEFAILLPQTDFEKATKAAYRIKEMAGNTTYTYQGIRFGPVTVSQGIDVLTPDGNEEYQPAALELDENADRACYHAKKTGKDRICTCTPNGPTLWEGIKTLR